MENATEHGLKSGFRSGPDVNFGVYFPCPECKISFDAWQGFVVHMIVDHWWEREQANNYWRRAVNAETVNSSPLPTRSQGLVSGGVL